MELGEREGGGILGRAEEGETMIKTYCMKKYFQ